jgi:transcriptional regulator with XRE-family HTH domain
MRRRNGAPFHHSPEAVTSARENAGLSQKELAGHLGISQSLMCEIEGGRRNATPDKLLVMARVLRCQVEDLQAQRDEQAPNTGQRPQQISQRANVTPLCEAEPGPDRIAS